ncbi:MAG: LytR C-terminal domain-containing protein [Candidatus Beckwithbacteria bacterium]
MNRFNKRDQKATGWKRLVISFFGLTLLILLVVWLVRGINQSQWNDQIWFGVVEQDQIVKVKLVSLKEKKLIQLLIPAETMVKVGFGFGEYRLGKVAQLGQLEKKPGIILTRSVQDLLGVSISGWQIDKRTNLTWWDKIRLLWFEKFTATVKRKVDLEKSLAWQPEFLRDQTKIFRVNQSILDQIVHEQIFNQQLAEEGLSVAVLNASGADGVAANVSRLASNLGIEVRLISNTLEQEDSQIIVANQKLKTSLTVKNLSQGLNINTIEVGDTFEYRSDIVIIVGQDYTKL